MISNITNAAASDYRKNRYFRDPFGNCVTLTCDEVAFYHSVHSSHGELLHSTTLEKQCFDALVNFLIENSLLSVDGSPTRDDVALFARIAQLALDSDNTRAQVVTEFSLSDDALGALRKRINAVLAQGVVVE
jgi:hypothetical protein